MAIVYSDAACDEQGTITYDWVVKMGHGQPLAGYGTVPDSLVALFEERRNQIQAGELLGALSAIYTCAERLRGLRVIHFVDNQGALASLISGSSIARDLLAIASVFQILVVAMGIRLWLEFVESDANVADGPSRLLAAWAGSTLCRSIGAKVIRAKIPVLDNLCDAPWQPLAAFPVARSLG